MPATKKTMNGQNYSFLHSQKVLNIAKAAVRSPVTRSNSQKHVGEFSKSKINGYEITH